MKIIILLVLFLIGGFLVYENSFFIEHRNNEKGGQSSIISNKLLKRASDDNSQESKSNTFPLESSDNNNLNARDSARVLINEETDNFLLSKLGKLRIPLQTDYVSGILQLEYLGNTSNKINYFPLSTPKGMNFWGDSFRWNPEKSQEGKTFEVVLRAKEGKLVDQIKFNVAVAKTLPLKVEFSRRNTILTINDVNCKSHQGKHSKFTMVGIYGGDFSKLQFRRVVSKVNYHIPKDVEMHSCLFAINTHPKRPGDDFVIRLLDELQQGLVLYKYTDFNRWTDRTEYYQKSVWGSTSYSHDDRSEGLFFIGK